ncbi:MAG: phosphoenolpyruvate carboxylase, partial [Candidatus Accumulibacter phosphatis]|nr:phosphoenolpyruvate carboxylase [Candidatus Accumulibacter phosphatis]
MNSLDPSTTETDKDLPLREDIRLLGRILGDTVSQQEGSKLFDVVESIRQNSVRFDRDFDEDARTELERILAELPRDTMLAVIRSFTYFLHLANIAED